MLRAIYLFILIKICILSLKIAGSINNEHLKLPVAANLKQADLLSNHEHEHDHEHEGHEAHEEHDEHEGYDHEEGSKDPHIWLDPVLNKKMVKAIKDDLVKKIHAIKHIMKNVINNLLLIWMILIMK